MLMVQEYGRKSQMQGKRGESTKHVQKSSEGHARIAREYHHRRSQDTSQAARSTPPSESPESKKERKRGVSMFLNADECTTQVRLRTRWSSYRGSCMIWGTDLVTQLLDIHLRELLAERELCNPSIYFLFHSVLREIKESLGKSASCVE